MPKPSATQLTEFNQFQRRQTLYEKRYQVRIFKHLKRSYNAAADLIAEQGTNVIYKADQEELVKVFQALYSDVTLKEAKISYREVLQPLEGNRLQKKDIIDDLIGILNPQGRGLVNIWRSLLDNFLQVRLTNRITLISRTTEERIYKLIEQGMFEGLGQEELARLIRREAGGNLNINRSRNIARTETVVAANQGKYLAAQSSNLVMQKKWVPAKDARTRRSHRDMLNRDWIGLNEDFAILNMELGTLEPAKHPGDDRLSAGNVINCRCSLIFQPVRDMNGNLIRKN